MAEGGFYLGSLSSTDRFGLRKLHRNFFGTSSFQTLFDFLHTPLPALTLPINLDRLQTLNSTGPLRTPAKQWGGGRYGLVARTSPPPYDGYR